MADSFHGEFRIVGGHPALDLVNTVTPRLRGGEPEHDYLTSAAELLAWSLGSSSSTPAISARSRAPGGPRRSWLRRHCAPRWRSARRRTTCSRSVPTAR